MRFWQKRSRIFWDPPLELYPPFAVAAPPAPSPLPTAPFLSSTSLLNADPRFRVSAGVWYKWKMKASASLSQYVGENTCRDLVGVGSSFGHCSRARALKDPKSRQFFSNTAVKTSARQTNQGALTSHHTTGQYQKALRQCSANCSIALSMRASQGLTAAVTGGDIQLAVASSEETDPLVRLTKAKRSIPCSVPRSPVAVTVLKNEAVGATERSWEVDERRTPNTL